MIGHALGASGALEAVVCVKSIVDGIALPTINYEHPDPECTLNAIPNKSENLQSMRQCLILWICITMQLLFSKNGRRLNNNVSLWLLLRLIPPSN